MATEKGVCGLAFGDEGEEEEDVGRHERALAQARSTRTRRAHGRDIRAAYFRAGRKGEDLPLHLLGTPWQIKVWQALLAIPDRQSLDLSRDRGAGRDAEARRARWERRSGAIRSPG